MKSLLQIIMAGLFIVAIHTGWTASHLESEKTNITDEQQKALDQLIKSLEVLRTNPESMKVVEEWFDNELKKSEKELGEIDKEISSLKKQLDELSQKKDELHQKLKTLQSGQRLISRLSGNELPAQSPSESEEKTEETAPAKDENNAETLFTKNVFPIFEAHCIVCHGKEKPGGELSMLTRETIFKGGNAGKVIVPGDPENSMLYQMVTHTAEPHMPLGADKLADEDIQKIAAWIQAEK